MLLDGSVDLIPRRQGCNSRPGLVGLVFKPRRGGAVGRPLQQFLNPGRFLALVPHGNDIAGLDQVRGDVNPPAVYGKVAVPDQLPGFVPGSPQAQAVNNVVQAPLQKPKQVFTGDAGLPFGLFKVPAELAFQNAVNPAGLLLLAKLQAVLGNLLPALAVLPRRVRPAVYGALGGVAPVAFQVKLQSLPAAEPANRSCVSCQIHCTSLNSPALGRPAAVVGNGGYVFDQVYLQACRLQRPDGRLAARAGPFNHHFHFLQAVLHGLPGGAFGRHLGGKGGALAGAFKAHLPRAGP
ncbi:hypothetical protein PTH_0348 [Pelotomaculum thermopropionicum SI]|uniref:Uncharacterized protein n=1 Tax=Pelotomaculum thermopropionicum (strain DSM 13744 / JCM 10971 / SI) TaxID=370438 RepID=A5D5E7_PELTS|nr:hypothetical protein PTH_0348 [Pelotomaculum thermopropionicum SI]